MQRRSKCILLKRLHQVPHRRLEIRGPALRLESYVDREGSRDLSTNALKP